MINNIQVTIAGGAGYTGGELIRLLLHHPHVKILAVQSNSQAGKPIAAVHQDLLGATTMVFSDSIDLNADLLFLCMGHGESRRFLSSFKRPSNLKIIDLSQDFRWTIHHHLEDLNFVYGLPELNREIIRSAKAVANPGCFATAIQLGLLPLAKASLLKEVQATGITGSTGAGQNLSDTGHFSWRANNIQPYKTLEHQHLNEIMESLHSLQPDLPKGPGEHDYLHFIPWRGDFTRGIFMSMHLTSDMSLEEALTLYTEYYASHPFTHVTTNAVFLKQVVNTNNCFIQLEKKGNRLVIHTVIDNLLKGASGQAVQNMNLMMGWNESLGLNLKASYF